MQTNSRLSVFGFVCLSLIVSAPCGSAQRTVSGEAQGLLWKQWLNQDQGSARACLEALGLYTADPNTKIQMPKRPWARLGAAPSSTSSISINQPPGSVVEVKSDTTPCVIAGLALSNSSACAPSGPGAGLA